MKTEELFIEYMDNLYRIAVFMLSNVQDAEDAVQETYVRYVLKKPKLNNQEHEKAWLMRVCINICKNQIRYRNRHPKYNIEEVDVIGIELEEKEILREISLFFNVFSKILLFLLSPNICVIISPYFLFLK